SNAAADASLSIADRVLSIAKTVEPVALPREGFAGAGASFIDLAVQLRLAPSKSEARRLVLSGGFALNYQPVTDPQLRVTEDRAINGYFVIERGKKQKCLVALVEQPQ